MTRRQAARQRELAESFLETSLASQDESDPDLPAADGQQDDWSKPLDTSPHGHASYGREIHAHLRELEREGAVHPNYMALQRDINAQMRSILVDWLVEVTQEYHLADETLHLCVYYTDRFLSRLPVQRSRLQASPPPRAPDIVAAVSDPLSATPRTWRCSMLAARPRDREPQFRIALD